MNEITQSHEIRLPVIVCPFCGEKDNLGLSTLDGEIENDVNPIWGHNGDLVHYELHGHNYKMEITGRCGSCNRSFEFIIKTYEPDHRIV